MSLVPSPTAHHRDSLLQACIKAPQDMAPAIVEELQNLSPCTQPQTEQEKLQVLVSGQFAMAEMPRKQLQDRVGGNRFEITTTLQEAVKQQEEAEMHLNMMRWLQGASCTALLHPRWYVQPRAHRGMVLAPHEPGGCVGAHCMLGDTHAALLHLHNELLGFAC